MAHKALFHFLNIHPIVLPELPSLYHELTAGISHGCDKHKLPSYHFPACEEPDLSCAGARWKREFGIETYTLLNVCDI